MIPLERWNVERSCTSCGKRTKELWATLLFLTCKWWMEHGGKFYVPPTFQELLNVDTTSAGTWNVNVDTMSCRFIEKKVSAIKF